MNEVYPIIVSPLTPEQQQIVLEVERRLSVAGEMEKSVETILKQVEHLRQSILKRAFEGKLVPQNPDGPPATLPSRRAGEPAEKLLERIKAEKNKGTKYV